MTMMMKQKMKKKGVASLEELRSLCIEADVKMVACQMTVDLFDMSPSEFIDGIEYGGAATFFEFAGESDICLFI
jgi:peroxiredoxin family protein